MKALRLFCLRSLLPLYSFSKVSAEDCSWRDSGAEIYCGLRGLKGVSLAMNEGEILVYPSFFSTSLLLAWRAKF
jgi:hypothetical protein